jgi:hypothetical protein
LQVLVLVDRPAGPVSSNFRIGMTRQPILKFGVIGLGPDWGTRYAPALAKLNDRIRLKAVYDGTPARAEEAALAIDATAAGGVRQVLAAESLDAVILLSLGWQGCWLLETVSRAGLPVFVGQQVLRTPAARHHLDRLLPQARDVIVPEQPLRYCPSMLRLRELMATQFGPVQRISINPDAARTVLTERVLLPDLLSWCCLTFGLCVGQTRPVVVDRFDAESNLRRMTLTALNGRPVELEVSLAPTQSSSRMDVSKDAVPFCSVFSQQGYVDLLGPQELCWDSGEGAVTEQLAGERSALDVMLDHFARRAAGGLIPVANMSEVQLGEHLASIVSGADPQADSGN